ncbi:hypothetical protein A2U01_0017507, partial [Trifolium medium]|nr:hypothetical protein [Trifolium medium]
MASSSTQPSTQNPLNLLDLPPIATIYKSLIVMEDTYVFNIGLLKLRPERMVDFESLKINGFDFEEMFTAQGWNKYFDMLNGPIYTRMVKEFWMKAHVFDKVSARMEEEKAIKENPSLAGKTRAEMGLCDFNETVVKFVLAGIEITISRAHIAKLLGIRDAGKRIADYKNEVYYRQSIKKELYEDESLAGKSKFMKDFYVVLFKVLINNIIPRGG